MPRIHLLVLGKGVVGGQLFAQLASERDRLRGHGEADLVLVGVVDSRASWFDPTGVDPRSARDRLRAATVRAPIGDLVQQLAALGNAIVVDCTGSDAMAEVYLRAFARGVHVVTANKLPLALPYAERTELLETARRHRVALRYETTVGASLPVIGPLQDLVRTGDRVVQIEGSLSGTLGYLADEVSRGVPLSIAVWAARERGYTEPYPRDDLAGTDVARKALILARELGLTLDLADVAVEPFVPTELLAEPDLARFLDGLAIHDAAFEGRLARLRSEGRALRYLATITPTAVRVGPIAVHADHPAARLRGTDALIAFRTARYTDSPLVVQGAGAGGAVTAAGLLGDVLAIARAQRDG